jgi:dTDP-glucose 4,6-dehydratase
MMVLAYRQTFGLPVLVTRCSNNYGPYQFPEKLIPLVIANAMYNKSLPIYGDGMNVRDWLHVRDHCSAIDAVLHRGTLGEVYNIGGNNEKANIEIVKLILRHLGKPESLITYVKDRPGHDRRYAIDSSRIQNELGWTPSYTFERGIAETVDWYVRNEQWWKRIVSGEYKDYYKKMYGNR